MERLRGVDANLLYLETSTTHMHTMKIAVLEPPSGFALDPGSVHRELRRHLGRLPPFRRRLVRVPLGLHHPVWVEADPDLEVHVRWMTAGPPGGPAQLDDTVGRIASDPLDLSRPPWEVWIVDGLAGGRVAGVAKIHHALADGTAVSELLSHALGARVGADPDLDGEVRAESAPSRRKLLWDALVDHGKQARELPGLFIRTARNLAAARRRRRELSPRPPLPLLDCPRTVLNGALGPRRTFSSVSLSLDDVRSIKSAFEVTVNDVILALVAGALRDYLRSKDALPDAALVAEVPASVGGGSRRLSGNELSNIFTSLCTDVLDPVDRLKAIHQTIVGAKELHELLGPDMYGQWSRYAPPVAFSWLVRTYSRLGLADHHRPPVNVIVSSVQGPKESLSSSGGRLVDVFSVGPLIEGAALNVTAWSYVDRVNVGVLSCPRRLPDPDVISQGIRRACEELAALAALHDRGTDQRGLRQERGERAS